MPKSRQRKGHKEKKQKFVNAQKEAKQLQEHRMKKYSEQLTKMFREQYEAKMAKEASTGPVLDSPIEGVVEDLTELSKNLAAVNEEIKLDEGPVEHESATEPDLIN